MVDFRLVVSFDHMVWIGSDPPYRNQSDFQRQEDLWARLQGVAVTGVCFLSTWGQLGGGDEGEGFWLLGRGKWNHRDRVFCRLNRGNVDPFQSIH